MVAESILFTAPQIITNNVRKRCAQISGPLDDRWMDGWRSPSRPLTHPSASIAISPSSSLPGCNQHRQYAYQSGKRGRNRSYSYRKPLGWGSGLGPQGDGRAILEGIRAGQQHHNSLSSVGTSQNLTSVFTLDFFIVESLFPSSRKRLFRKKKKSQVQSSWGNYDSTSNWTSAPFAGSGGDGSTYKAVIQSWSSRVQMERRRWTEQTQYVFY